MTLGEKIRAERRGRDDMSQQDFADLVGVPQSYISKWERGQGIDAESAVLLARATKKPVEYFLASKRLVHAKRRAIDPVARALTDDQHKDVLRLALRYRAENKAASKRSAQSVADQAGSSKRRRGSSGGSAPAA
jgi:transcriptional regulator with XRE-family HTH domain